MPNKKNNNGKPRNVFIQKFYSLRSGFMDFCFHQQRLDSSLSSLSIDQLVVKCSPLWNSLTATEKNNFKRY